MSGDKGASHAQHLVVPKSGVSAPSTGQTPDTFLTEVNAALEKVVAAINHILDATVNWVNDHIDELAGAGGAGLGGVVGGIALGPVGGVLGALGGHAAAEHAAAAIQDKLTATFNKINDKWQHEVEPDIRKVIGAILGDPLKMSQIGSAYRDAQTMLGNVDQMMEDAQIYEGSFSGDAASAYEIVRGDQAKALSGVQESLGAAATEMDNQEKTLLDYWAQQLTNIFNFISDMGEVADSAADVGEIALGDAGPVTDAMAKVSSLAESVLSAWVENATASATTGAGAWDGAIAALGGEGLPGGQWPRIDGRQLGEMNSNHWTD